MPEEKKERWAEWARNAKPAIAFRFANRPLARKSEFPSDIARRTEYGQREKAQLKSRCRGWGTRKTENACMSKIRQSSEKPTPPDRGKLVFAKHQAQRDRTAVNRTSCSSRARCFLSYDLKKLVRRFSDVEQHIARPKPGRKKFARPPGVGIEQHFWDRHLDRHGPSPVRENPPQADSRTEWRGFNI